MSRSKYGKSTERVSKLLKANPKIKAAQVMEKLGTSKTYTYKLLRKAKQSTVKHLGVTMAKDDVAKLTDEQTSRLVYNMTKPRIRLAGTQAMMAHKIGVSIEDYANVVGEVMGDPPSPVDNLPEGVTAAEAEEIVADVNQAIAQHDAHYIAESIETIDFIEAKGLGYHLGNVVEYITKPGGGLEDLLKAQWYLTRAIERVQD